MLAKHRTRLEGDLSVGELSRLSELCRSPAARIRAALEFEFEAGSGRLMLRMEVRGELELTCQRCLSAMPWRLDHTSRLAVVDDPEAAARLPRGADHIVCPAQGIAPASLVEEEVLLALPQIPMHNRAGQCDADMMARLGHGDGREARSNPFGILRNIRL